MLFVCVCGKLSVINTFLLIAGAIFSLEGESVGVGSPTEHIKMTEFKLLGIREEIWTNHEDMAAALGAQMFELYLLLLKPFI